ncbi:serine protease [Pontibacter sp. SGAir0037]|nr:serine protease [Pontibacter sp. SGAir0037]
MRIFASGLLFLGSFIQLFGQSPAAEAGQATVPFTVVYKLKTTEATEARISPALRPSISTVHKQVGARNIKQKFPGATAPAARKSLKGDLSSIYELQYNSSQSFAEVRKALLSTGQVEYVEPLYIRKPLHQPNDPLSDSLRTTQYYLKLIQAYEGWAVEKGDTGVVIGILDTNFRLTHEDLKTKVKRNYADPIDGIDDDGDGLVDNYWGWDFADGDNDVTTNPMYPDHGTNVAGVAAAASNNALGIAGVGYNLKFMPLKVFSSSETGGFAGFDAIVYAADKGCKVINISWGGNTYSQYEQDIINYAVLVKDAAVVAAAGNTDANMILYPAAYENVLAVGGTNRSDVRYTEYSYNYLIDISAPSIAVRTTTASSNNAYKDGWGSSFAAPMVAGAVGLVRSKYPQLTALQAIERVRATADNIYHLAGNQPYLDMLGKGRLNVKRALKENNVKSVRSTSYAIQDDRIAQIGDTILLQVNFTNFLAPVENLLVNISSPSPFVTFLQNEAALGAMGTLITANNNLKPFRFILSPLTPANHEVNFRLSFTDGSYQDFQYIRFTVNPDYITLNTGKLQVTVNNKGNFGYNGLNTSQGIGVKYKGSNSLLYTGGLMVASEPTRVSDNIYNSTQRLDNDFRTVTQAKMDYSRKLADQEVRGVMKDKYPDPTVVGLEIKHKAFAWTSNENQDFIILEYFLKNATPDTLKNVYAGLYADWDIGNANANTADWTENLNLGYIYSKNQAQPFSGIKLLTHDSPSYYAIDNANNQGTAGINVIDGFSAQEKYNTLANGIARKQAGSAGNGNDVSHVVGSSFKNLAPGQTKIVAFAVLAADNLDKLKVHAQAAQNQYFKIKSGPAPLAVKDTLCLDSRVVLSPAGGSNFNFYADKAKETLLATGASYTIPQLQEQVLVYVSNIDSLFESSLTPSRYTVATGPVAEFSVTPDQLRQGREVVFNNQSQDGKTWFWQFGDGVASTEEQPTHTYTQTGEYKVTLQVTDRFGCSETSSKTITILAPSPNATAEALDGQIRLYPNPSTGIIKIILPELTTAAIAVPEIIVTDMVGRSSKAVLQKAGEQELFMDMTGMAEGVYFARITYNRVSITKKLVLLKQ